MTLYTAWDLQVLKRTCYAEARGEGTAGMNAQAWSMINRHKANRWYSGKTYAQTCLMALKPQYPQYDAWLECDAHGRALANWLACVNTPDDDPLMRQAEQIVINALTGISTDDPTDVATHYFDVSISPPSWTAPPAILTLSQGRLRFYKNVD